MANSRTVKIYFRKNILLFFMMLLLMVFLLLKQGFGQDTKPTQAALKNSVSLCFTLYGPELIGGYLNCYVSNRVSLNVGLGLNLDFHGGMNYYFTKRENRGSSFYVGFQAFRYRQFQLNIFGASRQTPSQFGLYLPLGVEYLGKRGFDLQLEVGANFVGEKWYSNDTLGSNNYPIMISLKIGGLID